MPGAPDQRRGPDRRSRPRGGRRVEDKTGYAPLVLLVDEDAASGERCEAILAKLHFAVAPARSVEEALRVMSATRTMAAMTVSESCPAWGSSAIYTAGLCVT